MSASTTAIIAAVAAQRQKVMRHFVAAGAISPQQAISASALPKPAFRMLQRLKREGVVCETQAGLLYLDQARAADLHARRQSTAVKLMTVVVLIALAAAAFVALRPGA